MVFSAFHPELARAGIEANFSEGDTEVRLGAEPYSTDDYLNAMDAAGFARIERADFRGDAALVSQVPVAAKYLGKPLLLLVRAERPAP